MFLFNFFRFHYHILYNNFIVKFCILKYNAKIFFICKNNNLFIKFVSSYYKNDIFDVLTLSDIFKGYDYDKDLQYMKGTGVLSYYLFNMTASAVENHKNGLVAI